ncbi:RNA polymerase I-specific transcription initiation factor RRN3 [Corythoichthys intestinalis]|uniref:RNA polymerase I-specific transcription initiation factor RRN3 n=1 Tax=Corythoichthys intestinalis TaxID=161448 RepID=UPI0025A55F1F|nr:RNA polymerase I-specific transcription initiation factor RRN3 [Corythoichthys intestinalis]XP_057673877.1 RNA polymerase I-specific transcription initiation factor RRN3 [Corythoichthys intestinalis]XP_057673878.1 RNA polymerase I-specific transcription initiation factor RRN3 [Corythoichthys intestinalis]XP_061805845.1 RNA polymerase I-specific transcription initiation factor RRN3 [Nerophis lumbriciformis]
MDIESRDFLNTPPLKTVRFGGSVVETLAKYKQGDLSDYELLKHQLADPEIKDTQIITWIQELRNCVTQLTKDHEQLIYTILKLPWLGRSQAVVDEYMAFLSNLVSAQTVFLCACLKMVVSHFLPTKVTVCEEGVDLSDTDDEDENLPRKFNLCHQALQLITRYVPSTSHFLVPILQDSFPFVQQSSRILECYVHNLLRVTVYIPTIRRDVLEIIIGQMLKLDVSASRADIEEAEENALQSQRADSSTEEALFDMDEDLMTNPDRPSCLGVTAHPVAERLDSLMTVLLAYIKDVCHVNGTLHTERTKELYRDMLNVFDKLILPTHALCHVQYIVFYLCSFRLALVEAFLEHLWKILQSPSQPAVLRQAAAGYMGSFLARAKFIPVLTVRACLDLLTSWIQRYIDSQDCKDRQAYCDVSLHGPFYAACQAVFYVLIFRHGAILAGNMKKGLEYLQRLNLERVVMCQLNPLKVCLPAVANMFAAITRKYQIVFCYTIIERNNRHNLLVVRSSAGGDCVSTNTNPLDCFFPYDPYMLKRSGPLIEPLYQVWEEPADSEVVSTKTLPQGSKEDDYDFLCGETTQVDGIVGMTPSSFDSNPSVGSPPVTFQRHC